MDSPAISVHSVSKTFRIGESHYTGLKDRLVNFRRHSYSDFWALRDIELQIAKGETVGVIGANGQGKSTLLQIIAGILRPTKGEVTTNGKVAILMQAGTGFHPDLTGRENVYLNGSMLGLKRKRLTRILDDIVEFAELDKFIDTQVKHYSSGMYVRLGFAVAVHADPEILLVDEVLAVGDEAFQAKCLTRISDFQHEGRSIVFVTHELDLVDRLCQRAVLLHGGEKVAEGPPSSVVIKYRELLDHASE